MDTGYLGDVSPLSQAWDRLQFQLQGFAQQEGFAAAIQETFGVQPSPELQRAWQGGNLGFDPARILLTTSSMLGGHSGAYAAGEGVILLASDRLLQPDQDTLLDRVLLEEFGHWLDGQLHPGLDSPGDEGEAFADLVTGAALSPADWESLRLQDDHGMAQLEGRSVAVEFTHIGEGDEDADGLNDGLDAGGGIAVLPPPALDPAQSDIAPRPPGPDTGPIPVGPASFDILANGMPILSSRPGAPTSIFLDFDGDSSGSNPYTATVTPYSEDADATTFNLSEQRNVWEAWREASAYFAIFDTNVTTIQPSANTPKAWLCVGNNISGGYSYVNVFPNNTPESWNNSGDARSRVSGLTHELGHNFGLQHQSSYDQWGTKTAEYASSTDAYHGPLMGVDYSGKIHKFILGHNATSTGATNLQDDIAIIASKIKPYQPAGGDGFRLDDQLWDPTRTFTENINLNLATPLTTTAQASQWAAAILERPGDVDGFSFTSAGGRLAICATPDVPSGVDLKLEIYDWSGKLLAASDGANNTQELSIDLDAGNYCALVYSHGNYGDLGSYFLSASALPSGWRNTDIGTAVSGYTVFDNSQGQNAFNLVASGLGLTSTADEVQYSYQTLNGDGSIIARVSNVDNTSANALVGIAMRESTAANARHVSVASTYGGGPKQVIRSSLGGSTATTAAPSGSSANTWLKLQRVGNVFTSFTSADGISWTQLSTATVAMANTITIGLVSSSANIHALNVGALDNVTVAGNTAVAPPPYNILPAPSNLSVSLGVGSGLNLAWDAVAGATGYAISRSTDGLNFSQIVTTATTTYSDLNLGGSARYFYRVSATDGSGSSTPSAAVNLVNRPSAVTGLRITKPSTSQLVLDWSETTGESGYRIQRSSDGGTTYTTLTTVGANVPSYTDNGLTSGQAYAYIVTPTSALGDGVASAAISGAPRLAAVTPTIGAVAAGSITLNWGDLSNETGYRLERSSDGSTFTTLANVAANVLSYVDNTVAAATEVYYRVFGTTTLTQSLIGSVKFAASPSVSPPPAPWSSTDIGTVSGAGSTDLSGGTFKQISSGSSIGGGSDSFRFTSQPLVGNGEVVARVASVENTASTASAGVMLRQSTAANAANAYVYVTPTSIGFSTRATAGGTTTAVATTSLTAPNWVKLSRSGNTFSAFYSADGVSWTPLGTAVTLSMTSSTVVGLASTAGSTTALNTSTLSNVAVTVPYGLSITDVSQSEGHTGSSNLVFTVNLSAASSSTVSVDYATADGTAFSSSDYTATSGTLIFLPGETSKPVSVSVNGDLVGENDETFLLNLSNAAGSAIVDSQGQGTIQNDDTAGINMLNLSGTSTTEAGSTISFDVVLTSQPTADVSIPISSSNLAEGVITSPSILPLVFTAANWNVPQSVTVTGVNDSIFDGNKVYAIVFGSAQSSDSKYSGLSRPAINLTNLDDDLPPPTSFYAVNDGAPDQTFEYSTTGVMTENYSISTANTSPRGAVRVMNASGQERVLILDKNRSVYVYNNSGALIGSWLAGTIASSATVEGIASDGSNIWIVDAKSDKLFYYAGAASRTSGTQTATSFTLAAGNTNPKDLVYGGGSLWIVNDATTDSVYRYTVTSSTGGITLANSWALNTTNAAPTGISLDPSSSSGDLWVLDNGTSKRVYRYAGAQTWTGGPAPTGQVAFNLHTNNANPQGLAMGAGTAPAILAPADVGSHVAWLPSAAVESSAETAETLSPSTATPVATPTRWGSSEQATATAGGNHTLKARSRSGAFAPLPWLESLWPGATQAWKRRRASSLNQRVLHKVLRGHHRG